MVFTPGKKRSTALNDPSKTKQRRAARDVTQMEVEEEGSPNVALPSPADDRAARVATPAAAEAPRRAVAADKRQRSDPRTGYLLYSYRTSLESTM